VLLAGGYAIGMLALIEPLRARARWAHERIAPDRPPDQSAAAAR
jgi:hypothetical protein